MTLKQTITGAVSGIATMAAAMATPAPVLPRDVAQLPVELPRGAELPADHDPLAPGILMAHQLDWIEDKSPLKLGEKGRRCGLTYAEALDDTITAASSRAAGGDNVFYIGDTKDKGREFIGYVAHFARIVAKELVDVEEFLFEDEQDDGSSKFISAYRVRFASGFRVEALSSRPENIRGLQGIVVIDEAAFHKDVRQVLDAVNALLVWDGKIRIISTHNGVLNPFNELIREAKAGKVPYSLHFVPFSKSIANGLYRRVCLVRGKEWSPEAEAAWEARIRGAYGVRTAQMRQELDAIPADAEGAALTAVAIDAVADETVPVVRWLLSDDAKMADEATAKAMVEQFCREKLDPVLKTLARDLRHDLGSDFARTGDASTMVITETGRNDRKRWRLVIEMRNVPFEIQRDVVLYVMKRLPRFGHGAFDANGNGAYVAERARQRYGERVSEVKANQNWYRAHGTAYVEAFGDRTIVIAGDKDVKRDQQALAYVDGVIKVPDDMRYKGEDGLTRHGDSAIAGMLAWFASRQGAAEYGYTPVPVARYGHDGAPALDDDFDGDGDALDLPGRSWWRPPLGARMRGGF